MIHTHRAQLRFSDLDVMGHVNHARFLTYLEDARLGLLRKLSESEAKAELIPGVILAQLEVEYLRPLMLSAEPVEVEVWVQRIGTKSFTLGNEIRHDLQVVAKASMVMVAFDYETQAARPLSEPEREVLSAWGRD